MESSLVSHMKGFGIWHFQIFTVTDCLSTLFQTGVFDTFKKQFLCVSHLIACMQLIYSCAEAVSIICTVSSKITF